MEMYQYTGIHIIIFCIMAFPLEVIALICSSLNNLLLQAMEQLKDDTNWY